MHTSGLGEALKSLANLVAVVCLLSFSYKRHFELLASSDFSCDFTPTYNYLDAATPTAKDFSSLTQALSRKHTKTRSMMGLSKLISTKVKRLTGCSSFGARLLLLASWQQCSGSQGCCVLLNNPCAF